MTFQTAILTGTYQKLDGTPASGLYEIIPNSVIIDQTGNAIRSGYQKGQLDSSGHFSVTLPATDDATLEPATGRQYTIIAKPSHSRSSVPILTGIELHAGQTYDTADLTSDVEADAVYSLEALEAAQAYAAQADSAAADAASSAAASAASAASITPAALAGNAAFTSTYARFATDPDDGSLLVVMG